MKNSWDISRAWVKYCNTCKSFIIIWTDTGGWAHEICKCRGIKVIYWDNGKHHQCLQCGKQRNHWDSQPVDKNGVCWDCKELMGLPRHG